MSKFKGRFYSERILKEKGLNWVSDFFFFEMIVLTLAYHTVEYNDAVDEISTNILRMGGRLEDIYAEFLSIRNSATFINNFTVDDSMNRTDLAKSQRIAFSAPDFITTVRRMRNNSIPNEQVGRYLFALIKQLNITNAQLRNFASLANKFNKLPMKQQVETVLRLRNYASMHYKGSMSNLLTTKLYKHITTQYNTEETYTDSKNKSALTNPDTLAKAAAIGLVAYGTTKLSGKLIDLVTGRKNDDSWAKKISGKADHVGFDDAFRK